MATKHIKIDDDVKDVLQRSSIDGKVLRLPEQLDRALYEKVNKILKGLGGRWNRFLKGHTFDIEVETVLAEALDDGKIVNRVQTLQFFQTPEELAKRMVEMAGVAPGHDVLEPSAGHGRLAIQALLKFAYVTCIEIDEHNVKVLEENLAKCCSDADKYSCQKLDFMKAEPPAYHEELFDVVLMNPPFSESQDLLHIRKAFSFLRPGGCLVSVLGEGAFFKSDKKTTDFWKWLDVQDGHYEEMKLPESTFKESGTNVNARLLKIVRYS